MRREEKDNLLRRKKRKEIKCERKEKKVKRKEGEGERKGTEEIRR